MKNLNIPLPIAADSYKASQYLQYPQGIEFVNSYVESRGGRFPETVFFGLQAFIKDKLLDPVTREDVDLSEEFIRDHGEPFNREGWDYIVDQYGGRLPIEIQAVAEGTVVDTKNVLAQVINTDPRAYWLTSYLETALLRSIWYPTTVATLSRTAKKKIYEALKVSSDDPDSEIGFKLHDFGGRGVSSQESAALGGASHLVNFMGTDTMEALPLIRQYYGERMAGFSIPASEHSTMTSWNGPEGELDAMRNMLRQFAKPGSLVACVSDSYDIYRATTEYWGTKLKQDIIDSGATLVVRPDSGDPTEVPLKVIELLMDRVGYETNSKGYRVLPQSFRVIQGDGINIDNLQIILDRMLERGLSVSNIAFGMGGGLLQQVNRDTQKFAMKASAARVNGEWRDVYKSPIDQPDKKSKTGRLALIESCGIGSCKYQTVLEDQLNGRKNLLQTVYRNGELIVDQKFSDIRKRANNEYL